MTMTEFFMECFDRMHSTYFLVEVLPYWIGFLVAMICVGIKFGK